MENENVITISKKEYDELVKTKARAEIMEAFCRKSEYVNAEKGLLILCGTAEEEKENG